MLEEKNVKDVVTKMRLFMQEMQFTPEQQKRFEELIKSIVVAIVKTKG